MVEVLRGALVAVFDGGAWRTVVAARLPGESPSWLTVSGHQPCWCLTAVPGFTRLAVTCLEDSLVGVPMGVLVLAEGELGL